MSNWPSRRTFGGFATVALLCLTSADAYAQYNRDTAYVYASSWYYVNQTGGVPGFDDSFLTNHVNNPPYTWFYRPRLFNTSILPDPFKRYANDNGSNTVPQGFGINCTNFASQALQAGGVGMQPGDWPQYGNVYSAVARLAAVLPQVSDTPQRFTANDPVPSNLQIGDLIRWNNSHFTIVVATNPIQLAYHSRQVFGPITQNGTLDTLFAHYKEATAYHILGGTITALASNVAPGIQVTDAGGNVMQPDGTTNSGSVNIQITDSGLGFGDVEVTAGAPILDSMENINNGSGQYIFQDHTSCASTNHVCTVNLSSLQNGTSVYIQAFDAAGNVQVQGFTINPAVPPFVAEASPQLLMTMDVSVTSAAWGAVNAVAAVPGGGAVALVDASIWNDHQYICAYPGGYRTPNLLHCVASGGWIEPNVSESIRLIKVGSNGQQQWQVEAPNAFLQNSDQDPVPLAVDGAGDVFLLNSDSSGNNSLVKYAAATGVQLASAALQPDIFDTNLAVDPTRNLIYILGDDFLQPQLRVYDSKLNLQNAQNFPDYDYWGKMALDPAGNVYVTMLENGDSSMEDVDKWSPGLAQKLWSTRNPPGTYAGNGLSASESGALLNGWDATGAPLVWLVTNGIFTTPYPGPYLDPGDSSIRGDGQGNAYLINSDVNGTGVLAKLDSMGRPVWTSLWWQAVDSNGIPFSFEVLPLAGDGNGGFFSGGYFIDSSYDELGPFLGRFGPASQAPQPTVAASPDGSVKLTSFVTGETITPVANGTQAGALAVGTSQGLTLVSALYDISPSGVVFYQPAQIQFSFNPTGVDTTTLAVYTFNGVSWDSAPIVNQWVTVLSPSSARLTGSLLHASLYGLFSRPNTDSLPPRTTLNIGTPSYSSSTVYVSAATTFTLTAVDDAKTVGDGAGTVAKTFVAVDSATFSVYGGVFTLPGSGLHAIRFYSTDVAGNVEIARSSAVAVDGAPPVTTLTIGSPRFSLSTSAVLVSSSTPFAISAVDPSSGGAASGVSRSFYAMNGGSFAVYAATFTLAAPDGPQTISYYSQDNVLNVEGVNVSTVVLDSTPPEVALLSPGSCAGGLCRVVKGKFPVLGTARDLHFGNYILDCAPGRDAASGFALIGSSAVAVSSGTLGTWDASSLAGWQTLRLTAVDLVGNASVAVINVFVGDPGELMILGNHDVFDLPQDVAADSSGNIYVADTNANRIAVFSATGAFVAASTVRLNKPKGVAVDLAGNVYVADTDGDRVLELSATGQILMAIGRREKADNGRGAALEFHPGKGPGEFNKPSGVALDASGNIYVADTNNNRVQVLSSTGAPRLAFSLPPLPARRADEKQDRDADRPALGRPFGLAVDASGSIYVADPAGSRALVFSATGQLLLTLPIAGATEDGKVLPGRPEGIAVSADGFCLFVSDRKLGRVLKFDALGDPTLAFGAPGRIQDGKPLAGIAFLKPAGLALAPDGTLLVADRNNDRVERFGPPTGKPALVAPPSTGNQGLAAKDVLDKDEGGTVARGDRAAVTIPPGALADDLKVTVSTMSPASAAGADRMGRVAGGNGLAPASAPVEYGPEGTAFAVPVTLTVPYDSNMVAAGGLSEDDLKVHYWNKDKSEWEALDSTVDKTARTLTAKTPHFSLYQVLGSTGAGGVGPLAAADPTFALHAAYVFPNPARGVSAVTIRIQPGLADSVEARVYDVTGRRVHASSDFRFAVLDDGNGLGAQDTYDHAWDVSGVGSGVYTYVITAKKAGQADIRKTGKVGVVK